MNYRKVYMRIISHAKSEQLQGLRKKETEIITKLTTYFQGLCFQIRQKENQTLSC